MSEYPSSPSPNIPEEGICVSDSEAEQIQRSHPTHVSFADRVKHEIALNEDGSNTASKGGSHLTPAAPQAKRMRTPVQRTTPPQSRRKVKSKNQFAYMRIMADNKPVSYPPDKLTWDEVSRHNSRHDCWTVVNGIVYDITSYLDYHPGGKGELMQGAGKDCTELFNAYHPWVSEAAILRNARLGPVVGGHCPPEMVAKSHDKLPVNATNIPGVMRPGGDPTKIVSMTVPPLEEPALPSIPERSTLKPASGTVTSGSPPTPVASMLHRPRANRPSSSKKDNMVEKDKDIPKQQQQSQHQPPPQQQQSQHQPPPQQQPHYPLIPLLFRGSVFFPGMKLFPPQPLPSRKGSGDNNDETTQ